MKMKNGKDFIIISEDKEIKVHKLILQARSELFRGMFVSVNDNSNRVNDYSDKSNESLSYFIKFLYYDEIDYGMKESIYDDLEELQDFYQLNERSFLRDHIDNLKSNF
ncbi:leucine-zipper-like transcriptional regulator 1 [Anaeramoeba ignava]|uniref:Leucine-zipper-like transcriptional regulator 1 n=1 Tax=Anaeramoeba ignava TaxID=1746090 RepID=A0A9Q0RGU8_ANAIG|nr:leucine-zipper-like transcriptional regulator 1 [Anaeramoeba ignava]